MGDELQKTRVELRKTRSQLDREQRQKRTHIAILEEGKHCSLWCGCGWGGVQVCPLSPFFPCDADTNKTIIE